MAIDSAAAVAAPEEAIARLERLMPLLDRRNAVCVDWQRTGTTVLPQCATEPYLRSLFPRRSPDSGAMVTLSEASAIEAHNEAVRDAVIHRECVGAPDARCGPRVHAAAVAALADADADAQDKLEAIRKVVVEMRPRRLILVTSGLPFRSEPSGLKKLIAAGRDGRCELLIVRVPAVAPPTGVLSDGLAKIEQRLKLVRTMTLPGPDDVERAAAALVGVPGAEPRERPRNKEDRSVGSEVIARLHGYVTRFSSQVRLVVAREHYEQQVRSRAGSYGQTGGRVVAARTTDAEVTFANPVTGMWMMARSVMAVDGKAVTTATPRAIAEASSEAEAVAQIAAVVADNARWNIGGGHRTINTPTLVLWFMTAPVVERFQLTVAGSERTAAGPCLIVRFVEKSRPPLLEVEHERIPASGRLWVLSQSGAVVKTEMALEQTRPSTRGRVTMSRAVITVDYSYWPATQLWVPRQMTERYEKPDERESSTVLGTAQYSDYKLFRVGVRIR